MGTHPIFESDFDCLTEFRALRMDEKRAAKIIARAWLIHRDKQIYQILRAVACVSEGPFGQILLTRLAPIEAQFLPKDSCRVKLALAGDTFPPKDDFKVSLMSKGAVCYLSGRRELKSDVDGAISMMGERNFCAQLTSDLIERKNNRGVIDEIDVGTEQDLARLKAYTDNSSCLIGGKDNGWRRVDLRTLPRAAPFRDLYEVVQSNGSPIYPRVLGSAAEPGSSRDPNRNSIGRRGDARDSQTSVNRRKRRKTAKNGRQKNAQNERVVPQR